MAEAEFHAKPQRRKGKKEFEEYKEYKEYKEFKEFKEFKNGSQEPESRSQEAPGGRKSGTWRTGELLLVISVHANQESRIPAPS
jgi:hypothetical protein